MRIIFISSVVWYDMAWYGMVWSSPNTVSPARAYEGVACICSLAFDPINKEADNIHCASPGVTRKEQDTHHALCWEEARKRSVERARPDRIDGTVRTLATPLVPCKILKFYKIPNHMNLLTHT